MACGKAKKTIAGLGPLNRGGEGSVMSGDDLESEARGRWREGRLGSWQELLDSMFRVIEYHTATVRKLPAAISTHPGKRTH